MSIQISYYYNLNLVKSKGLAIRLAKWLKKQNHESDNWGKKYIKSTKCLLLLGYPFLFNKKKESLGNSLVWTGFQE